MKDSLRWLEKKGSLVTILEVRQGEKITVTNRGPKDRGRVTESSQRDPLQGGLASPEGTSLTKPGASQRERSER